MAKLPRDTITHYEYDGKGNINITITDLIRCKDCRWKQGSECVRFADVRPFPDDFCSRAELRGDSDDN